MAADESGAVTPAPSKDVCKGFAGVPISPTGLSDTRPLLAAGLTQGGGYTTAERERFTSCMSIQGHHWKVTRS